MYTPWSLRTRKIWLHNDVVGGDFYSRHAKPLLKYKQYKWKYAGALKFMNTIPLNTHLYYVTALETEVTIIVLLSFWISKFCLFNKNVIFEILFMKVIYKCHKAFCDSNAYVIKRLLFEYGNINYVLVLTSRNITPHQNSYIYFHIQPITYNYLYQHTHVQVFESERRK